MSTLYYIYISSYPPIFLEAPDKGGKNWGFLASESRFSGSTWRIIPVGKWLITMVIVSSLSKDRIVGPLPNGLFMAYRDYWLLTKWI